MPDKISILVVVDEEDNFEKCAESIKAQTYGIDNLEMICMFRGKKCRDNYSSLVTTLPNVISECADEEDSRECLLNKGMDIANGSYVIFLDANTYLKENAIELLYKKAVATNSDMVQGEYTFAASLNEKCVVKGDDYHWVLKGNDNLRKRFILNHYSVSSNGRLYRKAFLDDKRIRFVEAGKYSDVEFTGMLLFALDSVYHLSQNICYEMPGNEQDDIVVPGDDYSSDEEILVILAIDYLERELERLGLLEDARGKFLGEYQFFVMGKTYFDTSYRLKEFYGKRSKYFLDVLLNRFPEIANNGYLDSLKQKNNVECIEELRRICGVSKADSKYDRDTIHICMGLHDKNGKYSSNVGSVIVSTVEKTTAKVCFHIFIDDTVSEENRRKISASVGNSDSMVEFHLLNPNDIEMQDNVWYRQYTIGALFRLLIPRVLSGLHKVLYFDADLLVNRDIRELWNTDISDYCIAAVHDIGFEHGIEYAIPIKSGDVKVEQYFNSGVLLMNLDRIREKGDLAELCFEYLSRNSNTNLPDQDALNYVFRNDTLLLDPCWNTYTRYERRVNDNLREVIYHYMGEPFIYYEHLTMYDKLYVRTKNNTPWGFELVEEDLYGGLNVGYDKLAYFQAMTKAISTGNRKRIYYGLNTLSMKNIVSMIPPKEGDYCVCHDMIDVNGMRYGVPVKEFEDIASENKGDVVIFVLPDADGRTGLSKLNEHGFTNGKDYFVIPRLLTCKQGGYIR